MSSPNTTTVLQAAFSKRDYSFLPTLCRLAVNMSDRASSMYFLEPTATAHLQSDGPGSARGCLCADYNRLLFLELFLSCMDWDLRICSAGWRWDGSIRWPGPHHIHWQTLTWIFSLLARLLGRWVGRCFSSGAEVPASARSVITVHHDSVIVCCSSCGASTRSLLFSPRCSPWTCPA